MRPLKLTAMAALSTTILVLTSTQVETRATNLDQQKAILLRQARELKERNHIRQSVECCDRILRIDPNYGEALHTKGQDELALGQAEQAIRDLRRAKELRVGGQIIYQDLAHAYLETNQQAPALAELTAGINSVDRPHCIDGIVRERGELYLIAGQYKKALQDFSWAMQLNPRQPDNWGSRGKAYFAMGQYDKAAEDFSTTIKMSPQALRIYGQRADAYEKLGKTELAKRDRDVAKQGDIDF